MDIESALAALGGVARRKELVIAGFSGLQLERALTANRIRKPAQGVYALPDADEVLLASTCAGAELACISAAECLGLWILRRPALFHVSVDHGRKLDSKFRVHRSAKPLTPLDVCIQCLRCLPELDALCIVESAVVKGFVTIRELRSRTTGLRDATLRSIVERVDPHSQSIIETVAKYRLRKAGISFQSQVYVPGVGRLDLFVEGVLAVEADGRDFHSGPAEFEEDRRRGNLLTVGGIPVLRATYPLLVNRPAQFLQLVEEVLDAKRPTDRRRSEGMSR